MVTGCVFLQLIAANGFRYVKVPVTTRPPKPKVTSSTLVGDTSYVESNDVLAKRLQINCGGTPATLRWELCLPSLSVFHSSPSHSPVKPMGSLQQPIPVPQRLLRQAVITFAMCNFGTA